MRPATRAARPAQPPAHATPTALLRDVVVLGAVWGSSVMFQRMAVAEVPPLPLVVLRLAAALLFFAPFLPRVWRGLTASRRRFVDVCLIGVVNPFLCGVLSALALMYASSGLVAVLISLAPLLTVLLAIVVLGERIPSRLQLAGLAAAFAGVAVLLVTRSTGLGPLEDGDLRGHAMALAVALLMAGVTVYARLRLGGADPLAMAAGQIVGGLLCSLPITLLVDELVALDQISVRAWVAIVASGSVGLGASFVLFLGMIERHGPTASLLALYVMPVAAATLGALFLDETITPAMAVGAALVLLGVVLFTRRGR
ncbi:MAG: DMT family transporter [Chloroflexota bacterium]|nr:DMT family transporter [Chloroflexota bacterium]